MEKFAEMYFGFSGAAEILIGYHYFNRLSGKKSLIKLAASALVIVTVMQLCFGTVNSVIGLISPLMVGQNPDITAAVMIVFNLFSIFASCVCCEMMIKGLSVNGSNNENILAAKFIVPVAVILSIGVYINHTLYSNTTFSDQVVNVYEKYPATLIFQILGISALYCILRLFSEIIGDKIALEYTRHLAEDAKSRCDKTKSFRHDLKNHIIVLSGFLNRGDTQGATEYLAEIKAISEGFTARFQTGRAVADIIINGKLSNAEKQGIKVDCELKIPRCDISDSDLCIILANAVDNAIHACDMIDGNTKFIEINGFMRENIFLIEVKNSFDGKKFKKGTGLMNIEATAKKYNGSVSISCTEDIFTLGVLLNISQH